MSLLHHHPWQCGRDAAWGTRARSDRRPATDNVHLFRTVIILEHTLLWTLYFVAVPRKLNVAINTFYQFTKALFILGTATKFPGCSHLQSNACHGCRLIAVRGSVAEILLGARGQGQVEGQPEIMYTCSEQLLFWSTHYSEHFISSQSRAS
jgi:hypothetical protein